MLEDITGAEARHLVKLPKADGLKLLARRLYLNYDELDEDLRNASFLDYHYNVLRFCAERGMPWNEVAFGLIYANTFFQHLVEDTLPQAICALHNLAVMYVDVGRLGIESAKRLVQYFTSSVLCHHRLFQFVFKQERSIDLSEMNLTVETPVNDVSLRTAEVLSHWEYKTRVKNVMDEEQKRMLELNEKKDAVTVKSIRLEQETENKITKKECDKTIELTAAEEFISSLVENKLNLVQGDVELDVENLKNITDTALAMKAIPVPADMQIQQVPGGNSKEKSRPPSKKGSAKTKSASRRKSPKQ